MSYLHKESKGYVACASGWLCGPIGSVTVIEIIANGYRWKFASIAGMRGMLGRLR